MILRGWDTGASHKPNANTQLAPDLIGIRLTKGIEELEKLEENLAHTDVVVTTLNHSEEIKQ